MTELCCGEIGNFFRFVGSEFDLLCKINRQTAACDFSAESSLHWFEGWNSLRKRARSDARFPLSAIRVSFRRKHGVSQQGHW